MSFYDQKSIIIREKVRRGNGIKLKRGRKRDENASFLAF